MKPLSSEANLSGSCVPLKDSMNEIKLMYIFEVETKGRSDTRTYLNNLIVSVSSRHLKISNMISSLN